MTKILVIEDEEILRGEVVEWLTLEGYETFSAEDGVAGVEVALQHLPDVIVCDITMPRLDGHGVLLEMRSNPATANTAFIFVTARAAYDDVRQGMELGADDYLTKPFTRLQLLQAIQTRLEKKTAQAQTLQRDVEQWQQAFEEEREQRLLKSKLVAMFSHDFRNPLTTIMSANGLLRDYGDRLEESRRMTHFNRIDSAARQLLQMLDDMLVVARMESGSLKFTPEVMNMGECVGEIVSEFQAIHQETHSLIYENQMTDAVLGDGRLLRQVMVNLLSNAIKYSPHGSEVRIHLERQNGNANLSVQDQGIGIPKADQDKLFSIFQRASNVGTVSGTGLGLAIVKQAADLYGGSIAIKSKRKVGTTITVTLPLHS